MLSLYGRLEMSQKACNHRYANEIEEIKERLMQAGNQSLFNESRLQLCLNNFTMSELEKLVRYFNMQFELHEQDSMHELIYILIEIIQDAESLPEDTAYYLVVDNRI